MTAYASVDELQIEMRTTFSEADEAYAESVLERIGSYLAQKVEIDDTDEVQAENLKYASLSMASRIMASATASDVSSMTTQAGSYMQTLTYAQPYSTSNLWKLLKSSGYATLLGISGQVGFARPSYGRLEPADD